MTGIREIVFDTETTGFDAKGEDRITEIGCIEIIDLVPTGENFHTYLDPQRDVPDAVVEITGLTTDFFERQTVVQRPGAGVFGFCWRQSIGGA